MKSECALAGVSTQDLTGGFPWFATAAATSEAGKSQNQFPFADLDYWVSFEVTFVHPWLIPGSSWPGSCAELGFLPLLGISLCDQLTGTSHILHPRVNLFSS